MVQAYSVSTCEVEAAGSEAEVPLNNIRGSRLVPANYKQNHHYLSKCYSL